MVGGLHMLISENLGEYARSLARDCRIDSTCVFISDKTTPQTQLHYLGNFGVSEEILSLYKRHGICDSDPFTDVLVNENRAQSTFRAANDSNVERCGLRADPYWDFVSQMDIDVVGAATLRLQSRLYLVIGAHRSKRQAYEAVPFERLEHGIEILQNRIAANLLTLILEGGKGYKTLLNVVSCGNDGSGTTPVCLSPRETEVARLVCEGKQNKEIAWIAGLSECTVENHLRRIYQKLGIHNRAALVVRMNGVLV